MSESKQEHGEGDFEDENSSNVKVYIEPATPVQRESDDEEELDSNIVAEDSAKTPTIEEQNDEEVSGDNEIAAETVESPAPKEEGAEKESGDNENAKEREDGEVLGDNKIAADSVTGPTPKEEEKEERSSDNENTTERKDGKVPDENQIAAESVEIPTPKEEENEEERGDHENATDRKDGKVSGDDQITAESVEIPIPKEEERDDNENINDSVNNSEVQVIIEPATPRKDEEDDEDEEKTDGNIIIENSQTQSNETDTHVGDDKQDQVDIKISEENGNEVSPQIVSTKEESTELDAPLATENTNNNEDSKGSQTNEEKDTSNSDETSKDDESENVAKGSTAKEGVEANNSEDNPNVPKDGAAQESATTGEPEEDDRLVANRTNGQDAKENTQETSPNVEAREQPKLASDESRDAAENPEIKEDAATAKDSVSNEVRAESQCEITEQNDNAENIQGRKSDQSEKESVDIKSADGGNGEDGTFQVTTDVVTEDMTGAKKEPDVSEGSVGESDRVPKTPESVENSVDLPMESPLGRAKSRPLTAESEFAYNELDFPTPDYEIYGPTPPNLEGSSMARRQLSPSKKDRQLASRGEGTKSVTFADDVSKGSDRGDVGDVQSLETPVPAKEEDGEKGEEGGEEETKEKEQPKDGEGDQEEDTDNDDEDQKEEEEATDIFPTAVSEEKIEEAKRKQKENDSFTNKESLAIELFGASKFVPESMEDVITKRAYQHFQMGCNLAEQGDYCRAILSFDKALNLLPKEVKFYLMRGEAYLQLCDFQSAILNLKKACVLQPENGDYYSRLAFVYYFQGQCLFDQCLFAEALESFSRAAEMKPEIIAYHTRSIACLAALQRHGECLALVNRRLETERSNPDLYIMRARLHQLFRNSTLCYYYLKGAIALDPNQDEAETLMKHLEIEAKENRNHVSTLCYYDLKDALALDPNQEEAQTLMKQLEVKAEENRNHATRLQLQGKFKDSLIKISVAIEMNPSISEYHLQRGALQRRLHDYNAAIDDFLLAMDKTEHNEQSDIYTNAQRQLLLTYNDFAVECFMGGHFEEAILLLNKALKGEKREKGLYINRGDCFFRLKELHFALADYHQALEIEPNDAGIRSRVAAIHSQFGTQDYGEQSYQEAESRFTVALQHNPRHGAYYISRCKVRLMMENQTGARQDFLMGLHLDPSNTDILTLMPRIYPGKSVSDVMRTKQAKDAKVAADNAVMTASPIRLPGLENGKDGEDAKGADGVKRVTFDPTLAEAQDMVVPPLKSCMDEIEFNKVLTKEKRKVSGKVKTMLHDRGTLFVKDRPKLKPQPPPRPYEMRGGHWKNPEPPIKAGWRTFSLGVGLMD